MNNEIILDRRAIDYIRSWLDESGLSLSKLVLEHVDLEKGIVTTELPEVADMKQLHDFNDNILPYPPESDYIERIGTDGRKFRYVERFPYYTYAIKIIDSFLKSKGNICFMECFSTIRNAPFYQEFKSNIITHKDEIYHIIIGDDIESYVVLSGTNVSKKDIQDAINFAMSPYPPLICHLMHLPNEITEFVPPKEVTTEQLKSLASRIEKLVIQAYDSDAFIVWSRTINSPE